MTSIPQQISHLFFPPKMPETADITFKTAIESVNRQRIARITKAAVFALSSITATVCLVLSEAGIVTWPVLIPAAIVSLVAGLVFYRLNSLDKRYVEGLDDQTRSNLAKGELERIFLSKDVFTPEQVTKSLKNVNRLLGEEIFDKAALAKILMIHAEASRSPIPKSIAQVGFEQDVPVIFSTSSEWQEHGRYGLSSFNHSLEVKWDGNPENPITVNYSAKEVPKESIFSAPAEEQTEAAKPVEATKQADIGPAIIDPNLVPANV